MTFRTSGSPSLTRSAAVTCAAGCFVIVAFFCDAARGDEVITNFNSAALGSYNPREGWFAFGAGTLDRGVHASGSNGRGAFHLVDWGDSSWGVGNVTTAAVDLSAFTGIRLDARVTPLAGYGGQARLRFAIDMPGGAEWTTPSVPITSSYATYEFAFEDLTGSGALDLAGGTPKWILEKNSQVGQARFDFDEIFGLGAAGPYELSAVALRPPPDGDAVRAVWHYNDIIFTSANAAQDLLEFCRREGVNRIHLGAYNVWANGSSELKDNLRTFLRTAHASNIRVEALLDGTDWQDNPGLVQTRVAQISAFHADTPADATDDFDAIHFDIEFWLDSAFTGAANEAQRQQVARNYFDNVLVNARTYLDSHGGGAVDLAIDLSAHLELSENLPSAFLYAGTTQRFLEHAFDLVDDVVIMSYIDFASGLLSWTAFELDIAALKGRTVILAGDIHYVPPELPINSFADNAPAPFAALTQEFEAFHALLSPVRAQALAGMSIFYTDAYMAFEPQPRYLTDLDGDGDADAADAERFVAWLAGPVAAGQGPARDADFDGDQDCDLLDFAFFGRCLTTTGQAPLSPECLR